MSSWSGISHPCADYAVVSGLIKLRVASRTPVVRTCPARSVGKNTQPEKSGRATNSLVQRQQFKARESAASDER